MSRIFSVGAAEQLLYLLDKDDFAAATIGGQPIFGQIVIGDRIDIDRVSYEVGGSAVNAAVTFARHGHESVVSTNISHDSAGDTVLAVLDREGVDSSYVNFVRGGTGCSVIMLDSKTGDRTVLNYRGVSARTNAFNPGDLNLVQPDWLYVSSLNGDMNLLLQFFEKAHALGCKVMFNPGKAELSQPQALHNLLKEVDIVIVNKLEAAHLVPGKILSELLSHLSNYVETVIITNGAMGAIATDHQETYRLGVYEDVKVKDPSGSGDAFGAGFLAHFAAGHSFKDSLIFASANAASVIKQLGPENNILTGTEELHPMPIQEIK